MRLLVFNQYFCTPNGAYGTRIYEFARRWAAAGDRVTVVTAIYERSDLRATGLITRLEVEGVDVRAISIPLSNRHGYAVRALTYLAYSAVACWYALTIPADLVLASSGPITVGAPALLARYARRIPFVFEVRDLWPEGAVQLGILKNRAAIAICRAFERRCYFSAARVVALSEGMSWWIEERYGVKDVATVPNASDNELARQTEPMQVPAELAGKKLVVYAGALGFIHDAGQVVDIAEALRAKGETEVEFIVIGDGKCRESIARRAAEAGLTNVRLLGQRPKREAIAWLKTATCALSLVRNNAFFDYCSPNKIFDALAAGAPVVQDTQGWLKSLIETNGCGITTPRGDARAMAEAISRFAHEPAFRREAGANAVRVAAEITDRETLARRMRAVLESAVEGRRARAAAAAGS